MQRTNILTLCHFLIVPVNMMTSWKYVGFGRSAVSCFTKIDFRFEGRSPLPRSFWPLDLLEFLVPRSIRLCTQEEENSAFRSDNVRW